jgi:hypothetical protein
MSGPSQHRHLYYSVNRDLDPAAMVVVDAEKASMGSTTRNDEAQLYQDVSCEFPNNPDETYIG